MKKITFLSTLLCSSFFVCSEETDTTLNAYAAGYVANFTCSATFNAGKSKDSEHEAYSKIPITKLTHNKKACKSLFGVLAPVSFS